MLGVVVRLVKKHEVDQKGEDLKLSGAKAEFDAIARMESMEEPEERPGRAV